MLTKAWWWCIVITPRQLFSRSLELADLGFWGNICLPISFCPVARFGRYLDFQVLTNFKIFRKDLWAIGTGLSARGTSRSSSSCCCCCCDPHPQEGLVKPTGPWASGDTNRHQRIFTRKNAEPVPPHREGVLTNQETAVCHFLFFFFCFSNL